MAFYHKRGTLNPGFCILLIQMWEYNVMSLVKDIIEGQAKRLESAYLMLQEVMPEYFFRNVGDRIGIILPFLCNLEKQSGIRRVELNNEVFFIYLLSEDNDSRVTSRMMANQHLLSAAIHKSYQPLQINGEPTTLMIEHYVLNSGPAKKKCKISLQELQDAYAQQFGSEQLSDIAELYPRLNVTAIEDLDINRLVQRVRWVLLAQRSDNVHAEVEEWNQESLRLIVALSIPTGTGDFCSQLLEIIASSGLESSRCYFREISANNDPGDFEHLPVMVATVYLENKSQNDISHSHQETLLENIRLLNWVDMTDVLHQEFVRRLHFSLSATNWIRACCEFIHGQLSFVDRSAYNAQDIVRYVAIYPELSRHLFQEFERRFNPVLARPSQDQEDKAREQFLAEVSRINSGNQEKDNLVKTIFMAAFNFLDCILKTNFYCLDKAGLSFRLSPEYCLFYRSLNDNYSASFPADMPYGVFFFYRRKAFGYQVRFADISRGGWRTVIPGRGTNKLEMYDNYDYASDEAYREVFVLANTQHLKNKDIYEGGAKMLTLMEPFDDQSLLKQTLWQMQRAFTVAFIALVNSGPDKKLRDSRIVDRLGSREIIEIGPDENLFDTMIEWMGGYAQKVGYTLGSGIISGKPGAGINHKEYGVTSFGVHQYLLKTLLELGIDPTENTFSIKIAGGPNGDVAGNEMKLLLAEKNGEPVYPKLKIVAITDGPAAAYDPKGLDQEELRRLLFVSALDGFNPEKLQGEGARIVFSKPIIRDGEQCNRLVERKNGKLVESLISRDDFMLLFQNNLVNYADVFVPAGGRPGTINEGNWHNFFPGGKPAFRAIVEGANSYITPGARTQIQQNGVWIVKDASANKCGVITSSYEILSGLMLEEEEFKANKKCLVEQVMEILRHRVIQEANWLYNQFKATGTHLTDLTEKLSQAINAANGEISAFLEKNPQFISDELLLSHLPVLFREKFPDRVRRLPAEYRLAIAAVELACRLVYVADSTNLENKLRLLMTDEEKANL